MKIVLVAHHALPHVGGVEVLIDLEVSALAARGDEVVLITSDLGGSGRTPHYPPSVRVIRVPAWHGLERRFRSPYPVFSPRLLVVLVREIATCDLVHAHGFMFMNSALALLVARLLGRPALLTDHGGIQVFRSPLVSVLQRCGAETIGRVSAQLADGLVSYNTRIARLLERFARTQSKSLFLPNPVNRTVFHPPSVEERRAARRKLGWPEGRAKVLFIGRLMPEKGVPLLLQARRPDFDLVFCGTGDPAILGPLPQDGVEYLPPRPQEEVVELYHAADVCAVPAEVREGFPLVVQEALSCGLPMVLGYDPGFEPYRQLPGLFLIRPELAELQRALTAALALDRDQLVAEQRAALDIFCPSPQQWIETLLAHLPLGEGCRRRSHADTRSTLVRGGDEGRPRR